MKRSIRAANRAASRRRGVAMVYSVVVACILVVLAFMVVEGARIEMTKTRMQTGGDAACRAAMRKFLIGEQVAPDGRTLRQSAQDVYLANFPQTISGVSIASNHDDFNMSLLDTEIQFVKWNFGTKQWTGPYTGTAIQTNHANAIRVIPSRSHVKANGLPLYFGSVLSGNRDFNIGHATTDPQTNTIETITCVKQTSLFSGFIGLDFLTVKNNLDVSSMNMLTGVPGDDALVASNGAITAKNNNDLGGVVLGPAASLTIKQNNSVTGSIPILDEPLAFPPTENPPFAATAPPTDFTNPIAGGTYVWSSLTMGNNTSLRFSGPATVYITGNVVLGNSIQIHAYNDQPINLNIRLVGAVSFINGTGTTNNTTIWGQIYGPLATLDFWNDVTIYGSAIGRTLTSHNNATFVYDDSLNGGGSATPFVIVK